MKMLDVIRQADEKTMATILCTLSTWTVLACAGEVFGIPAENIAELVGKDEMKRIEQGGMELFLSKLNEEVSDESVREFVAECEGVK